MRHLGPLALCMLLACGSPNSPAGSGTSGSTGGTTGSLACKDRWPASQTASEGCCLDWGVDACGAGLFCAAFDGRTQPTCYPEGSRRDGASCTGDVQCASGSCNTDAGKCRATPGTPCDASLGCAPSSDGRPNYCGPSGTGLICLREGLTGDSCGSDAQCTSGHCNQPNGTCSFTSVTCHSDADCAIHCVSGQCQGLGNACSRDSDCPSLTCDTNGQRATCS